MVRLIMTLMLCLHWYMKQNLWRVAGKVKEFLVQLSSRLSLEHGGDQVFCL